jgi:Protein of unknown function (DUF1552)
MRGNQWTRRQMLKGAGVSLALPWLETFAPRTAHAQAAAAAARKRFINLYFCNGTAEFWKCTGGGAGDAAWQLSPIMEPLAPVRQQLAAFTNVSNNAPFGGGNPEPSHSNLGATTYSCVKAAGQNNGITVDQVIANGMMGATKLHSLQVGLSTWDSSPDGLPGQHSRSMAWKSATEPLYKVISPQAVFDRIVATGTVVPSAMGNMNPPPDPLAERRRLLRKSALDYIIESSTSLQTRLGKTDRTRMDSFLSSARSLETRVADAGMQVTPTLGCGQLPRPTMTATVGKDPPGYNRNAHAELMIDLVVMALQCDTTRVVSFMLDDARSDYVYNFIPMRTFTAGGSALAPAGTMPPGNYHETQHAGDTNNAFATIGHWNSQKAMQLAQKLMMSPDGPAGSILDNTVIVFNSGMHGGNHDAANIPTALLGSGGKVLKTNIFHNLAGEKQLGDIYLTIMQKVFLMKDTSFGASRGIIPEILA